MDRVSEEKRSYIMSRVRGKDTQPEIIVRKMLHKKGVRYRLYRSDLPGKPDIVIPKRKLIVFIHGCFWHGHEGCRKGSLPKSKVEYWRKKIEANKERDKNTIAQLNELGWETAVIWQCETRDGIMLSQRLDRLLSETVENSFHTSTK